MFERIVVFWKGNDIVHLFGGFLRFGAQDKGPDQQHCQQPRGEPGEIQPHVLELGAPARKDLDGFIDGSHKKASRPHVEKGVQLHGPCRGQQPAGQPAQAGEFGKVGHLSHKVNQLFLVGEQVPDESGQKAQHPHAEVVGVGTAHQGVPPDKGQVAHQQKA